MSGRKRNGAQNRKRKREVEIEWQLLCKSYATSLLPVEFTGTWRGKEILYSDVVLANSRPKVQLTVEYYFKVYLAVSFSR